MANLSILYLPIKKKKNNYCKKKKLHRQSNKIYVISRIIHETSNFCFHNLFSIYGYQLNVSPHSFCTQFKIPILKQQLSFYLNIKGIIYGRNYHLSQSLDSWRFKFYF